MKKLYESFIKRRGMRSIRLDWIKRGVAKPLRKVYQKPSRRFTSHTRMPAGIRGYRIKRSVAKPLRKFYQTKGYGHKTIPLDRIKRGVAL
ncbi:Uncharacterised protein [uncultured archaeon]|nr:Uncharacterised protein [uncultured archaeon]